MFKITLTKILISVFKPISKLGLVFIDSISGIILLFISTLVSKLYFAHVLIYINIQLQRHSKISIIMKKVINNQTFKNFLKNSFLYLYIRKKHNNYY